MSARARVIGVILAGGLSRRMGGGDKGLIDIGGGTMLARVSERFAPQVDRLMVNANGDPARFAALGLPVVADTVEGFVGPLAGVLAGMRWSTVHATGAQWIATASSDTPFLPLDLVARMLAAVEGQPRSVALARSEGGLHPVIGLWPVALADDLEQQLATGVRKVLQWTDRHGTIPVAFEPLEIAGKAVDPFFNANTPEELDAVRALLSGARS